MPTLLGAAPRERELWHWPHCPRLHPSTVGVGYAYASEANADWRARRNQTLSFPHIPQCRGPARPTGEKERTIRIPPTRAAQLRDPQNHCYAVPLAPKVSSTSNKERWWWRATSPVRLQKHRDTGKRPPRARASESAIRPSLEHGGTSGLAVRPKRRRRQCGSARLRHLQRRLGRGVLPRQCRGLLRRRGRHFRCRPSGARAAGGAGHGRRRGGVVGGAAQEEAAAAGEELQVEGGGRVPADGAHRRGAQPPAPDERVPRPAPLPHAGVLRPEGRPSLDRRRGDRFRQRAGAAAAVPGSAEAQPLGSPAATQGDDADAHGRGTLWRRGVDEQLQQRHHRVRRVRLPGGPVRGVLHVPAVRVVPLPARLGGHALGGGEPRRRGRHRGEPGRDARQPPRHGAAATGPAFPDGRRAAGAPAHRAAPQRHRARLPRALLPQRQGGGGVRPDDGGRHRRGGAPCALLHTRRGGGGGGGGGGAADARGRSIGHHGHGLDGGLYATCMYCSTQLGSAMP